MTPLPRALARAHSLSLSLSLSSSLPLSHCQIESNLVWSNLIASVEHPGVVFNFSNRRAGLRIPIEQLIKHVSASVFVRLYCFTTFNFSNRRAGLRIPIEQLIKHVSESVFVHLYYLCLYCITSTSNFFFFGTYRAAYKARLWVIICTFALLD